jgi:mannose-1-phosphate guanylyltransferase
MNKFIAIMAGGVGSRFWPSSREAYPKQFLDILGTGKSLLRLTYERCLSIVPNEHVLIVTNKQYEGLVSEHLPELPKRNILCEPSRNNTAPCVAYTALRIEAEAKDGVMAILPSDHIILKEEAFKNAIEKAFDFAANNDALLTLGISPSRPDTGYGYIEMGDEVEDGLHQVSAFREKPDLATAKQYLSTGNYVWNAGIFIWSVPAIIKAFNSSAPNILEVLTEDAQKIGSDEEQEYIDKVYPNTESISVDYAIMERASNVYTIPAEIGWSDLGTWASLHDIMDKNENGAVLIGEGDTRDSREVLIKGQPGKLTIVEGLEDFIVIDEEDVLLIWPKSREQEIKALRNELKDKKLDQYL